MAKSKKVKLPKQVAGVKIPKEMRKRGELLIAQAQSEAGRAMIARGAATLAGLAATAVLATRANAPATSEAAAATTPAAPANDAAPTPLDPRKVAEAVNTVADVVLGRLFGGKTAA